MATESHDAPDGEDAVGFGEAIAFIEGLIRAEPRNQATRNSVGLIPIRRLLDRLQQPHHDLRHIHIAGSKGKGSTALLIERILRKSGRRTGLFTSPHLSRWTERVQVDGMEASRADFARACQRVSAAHQQLLAAEPNDQQHWPSFFDVLTATALVLFKESEVDTTILETGLGGRLDATNVVSPDLTCITTIELEHTDKLGETLAEIAGEKAGIVKAGVPLLLGPVPEPAECVIRRQAECVGAPVHQLGRELATATQNREGEIQVRLRGRFPTSTGRIKVARIDYALPPVQSALASNYALAAAAAAFILGVDQVDRDRLNEAFTHRALPGRLEFVSDEPKILVDGAHTTDSIAVLAEVIDRVGARETHLLVSVSGARDAGELLAPLLSRSQAVTVTRADPNRSMPVDQLAKAVRGALNRISGPASEPPVPLAAISDPDEALARARQNLHLDDLLVVTGSMYLAGRVRTRLTSA